MKMNMFFKKEFLEKIILVAVILILVFAGLGLKTNNSETVDIMLSDTTKTFVTVSILKGAVDVIEGSTLGAGGTAVEVGDITQPVLDSLNLLWKFLLAALAVWGCLKIFITAPSVVALIFLACAVPMTFIKKSVAKYFFFCAFILSLLPFAISGTGMISKHYIEPFRLEAERDFDNVKDIFTLDGLKRDEGRFSTVKNIKNDVEFFADKTVEIVKNSGFIISSMARGTFKYIVVLLLNSIVIPVILFIFFWGLGKNILLTPEPPKVNLQLPAKVED